MIFPISKYNKNNPNLMYICSVQKHFFMDNLISFRKADICAGENVVVYGLDMDVAPGECP